MSKAPKRPRDASQLAKFVIDVVTEGRPETTKKQTRAATAGKKGGPARSQALTPEQRSEIARLAAAALEEELGCIFPLPVAPLFDVIAEIE